MKELHLCKCTTPKCLSDYFHHVEGSKQISIFIQDSDYKEDVSITSLCELIKESNEVEHFEIVIEKYCILEDQYEEIGRALMHLKELKLFKFQAKELCYLQSKGLVSLAESIATLDNLQTLSINIEKHNLIQYEGIVSLNNCLKQKPNLKELSIVIEDADSKITSIGLQQLFQSISGLQQLIELTLKISTYDFDENCSRSLGNAISQLKGLIKLNLDINSFNAEIIDMTLAESIGSMARLQSLALAFRFNNYIKNDVFRCFINSFCQLTSITDIKVEGLISDNKDTEGYLQLSKIYQFTPHLRELLIDIQPTLASADQIIQSYSESIVNLNKVEFLDLKLQPYTLNDQNTFIRLMESIQKLKAIQNINLFFGIQNKLSLRSVKEIGKTLLQLPNLKQLKIQFSEKTVTQKIAIQFFSYLRLLTQLQQLFLQIDSDLQKLGCEDLYKSLSQLESLVDLELILGGYNKYYFIQPNRELLERSLKSLTHLKSFRTNETVQLMKCSSYLHLIPESYTFNFSQVDFSDQKQVASDDKDFYLGLEKIRSLVVDYQSYLSFKRTNIEKLNLSKCIQNLDKLTFTSSSPLSDRQFFNGFVLNLNLENLKSLTFECEVLEVNDNILLFISRLHNLTELTAYFQERETNRRFISDSDLEKSFSSLVNLKTLSLKLNKSENCQRFKRAFLALPLLSELNIQVCGGSRVITKPDFEDLITNLPNLKILNLKYDNSQLIMFKNLLKISQIKGSLQEFKFNLAQMIRTQNKSIICDSNYQFDFLNKNRLDYKKVIFQQKRDTYSFQFSKMLFFELLLLTPEEYILEQFQQILEQVRTLRYLHELTFGLMDPDDYKQNFSIQSNEKSEEEYQLELVSNETNDFESGNLKKLVIAIDNHLFSQYHAFMIGRELKYYNKIQHLTFSLFSKNNIEEFGLSNILESLSYLTNLNYLDIIFKNITSFKNAAVQSLGKSLTCLKYLKVLKIKVEKLYNHFDQFALLAEGLEKCTNLEELSLLFPGAQNLGDSVCLLQSMKNLCNLKLISVVIGREVKIEQCAAQEINLWYNDSSNLINKFEEILNTQMNDIIEQLNTTLMDTLINLKQLTNLKLQMYSQGKDHTFIDHLLSFITSMSQPFAIKLNYLVQEIGQSQGLVNYINQIQTMIKVFSQVLPESIFIITLNHRMSDIPQQNNIIICRNHRKELKITVRLDIMDIKNEEESEMLNMFNQFTKSRVPYQLTINYATSKILDITNLSRLIRDIITSANQMQAFKLMIIWLEAIEHEIAVYTEIFQSLALLKNLYLIDTEIQHEDRSFAKKFYSFLLRKCKRLTATPCICTFPELEEVD